MITTWLFYVNILFLVTDVDECDKHETNRCHVNATCTNADGLYTCECNAGYTGDGVRCTGEKLLCHDWMSKHIGKVSIVTLVFYEVLQLSYKESLSHFLLVPSWISVVKKKKIPNQIKDSNS